MKRQTCPILVALSICISLLTVTSANAGACPSSGCDTNLLSVPGDFANPVNNFTMHLLGGWFNVDSNIGGRWRGISGNYLGGSTPLSTIGNQIDFTASQFNHTGPGQGTSTLNASLNHFEIGSGNFFSTSTTIYTDGEATGTLVDNADSTQGHWTLNTHLYAVFGNGVIDLGIMPLSTNATYSYHVAGGCDENDNCTPSYNAVAAGSIMDYHSGLAYLVGQGVIQSGGFAGIRVTIGLQGQDPHKAPASVPEPGVLWLIGSGLLGLIGVTRKLQIA